MSLSCLWPSVVKTGNDPTHPALLPLMTKYQLNRKGSKKRRFSTIRSCITHMPSANKSMECTTGILKCWINIQRWVSATIWISLICPLFVFLPVIYLFLFFFHMRQTAVCLLKWRDWKLYIHQVMHLFGKKRKVALGQYLLLSVFLAGKTTHTQGILWHYSSPWALSFLKPEHTAVEGQENNCKTHTHTRTSML